MNRNRHGIPRGLFPVAIVVIAIITVLCGCSTTGKVPAAGIQKAKSTEKVESEATTSPQVESGGDATVNTRLEKKMNTIQTSVQEMQQNLNSATSSMQDKLAHTVKGVEQIRQIQKTTTTNYGISEERGQLEAQLYRYRFQLAGAFMGLFIAALFAPAFKMNKIVIWVGVGVGIAITAGSIFPVVLGMYL